MLSGASSTKSRRGRQPKTTKNQGEKNVTVEQAEIVKILNEQDSSMDENEQPKESLPKATRTRAQKKESETSTRKASIREIVTSPPDLPPAKEVKTLTFIEAKSILNSHSNMAMNRFKNLKALEKSEREKELSRLWAEELEFQAAEDNLEFTSENVEELKLQVQCRRDQIDTLEWILTTRKKKEKALEAALAAKIEITIRSVLDFYKNMNETTVLISPSAQDELTFKSETLQQLETKEQEWSIWFMGQVMSNSGIAAEELVGKNIIEQSLDVQLKRKKRMVSLIEEIKQLKKTTNSKVLAMKRSKVH